MPDSPGTLDLVRLLPQMLVGTTGPEDIDENGHTNVRSLYDVAMTGAERLMEAAGIDAHYRGSRRLGAFAAEHHVRFLAEMHKDARFAVHAAWLGHTARAAHTMVLVLNLTTRELTAIVELIVVNVDLETRRSAPFPEHVVSAIDESMLAVSRVPFTLPRGGAIGLRQPA